MKTTFNYTLHLPWTRADGAMPQEGVAQTTFQVGAATALLGPGYRRSLIVLSNATEIVEKGQSTGRTRAKTILLAG